MRTDADVIALRAIANILGGARAFELAIEGKRVTCAPTLARQEPWPAQHRGLPATGTWPRAVDVKCQWEGGTCALRFKASVVPSSRYEGDVGAEVLLIERTRQLVWRNFSTPLRKQADTVSWAVQLDLSCRKPIAAEVSQRVTNAEKELLSRSGIPTLGRASAEGCSVDVPSGAILPSPEEAFRRFIQVALLKLDFIDPGAAERGSPLIDIAQWGIERKDLVKADVAAPDEKAQAEDEETTEPEVAPDGPQPRRERSRPREGGLSGAPAQAAPQPPRDDHARPPTKATASTKASGPVRVFSWVHLSDLHFGAGSTGYRFDHKRVMRAIVRDLQNNTPGPLGVIDRLFVTGDIAFSGNPDEYEEATKWFIRAAQAATIGLHQIRLVPGNHDVDRQVLRRSPLLRCAHHAARAGLVELDDLLEDQQARHLLGAKLEPYRRFVDAFAGHPEPLGNNGLDWIERIDADPDKHGPIRIAGLSTVWTSDERDGRDVNGNGNLRLAQAPLDALAHEERASEITFVLTHHPPEWLTAEAANVLRQELARVLHVHLLGHVHDARAVSAKRHGRSGRSLWYVAGAAHADPSEAAKHGYAWGALRYDPARERWEAGWAPRIFVATHNEMRADRTDHNLDEAGFAWEEIPCGWPAPLGCAG